MSETAKGCVRVGGSFMVVARYDGHWIPYSGGCTIRYMYAGDVVVERSFISSWLVTANSSRSNATT